MSTMVASRASLAAQVAAQARPAQITPIRSSVLPPSTAPIGLSELDQRFRGLQVKQKQVWAESAYVAFRLDQANEWEKLGFRDAAAYCDAIGIGYSHWRSLVCFGDRLQNYTLQELQGLTFAAMRQMLKIHQSIWGEYAWVEEAKSLPTQEFAMLVAQRNEQVTKSLVEPKAAITLRVPLSQQAVVERRLEAIRRQECFSSTAEALAYALESVDRADSMKDTLADIRAQVAELTRIQHSLRETPEELEQRLDGVTSDARIRAAKLANQILRTVQDALPEEEVSSAGTGAEGQEV